MNPSLSSVNQDRYLAGQLIVDKLFDLLEGGHAESEILTTELVVRESS